MYITSVKALTRKTCTSRLECDHFRAEGVEALFHLDFHSNNALVVLPCSRGKETTSRTPVNVDVMHITKKECTFKGAERLCPTLRSLG